MKRIIRGLLVLSALALRVAGGLIPVVACLTSVLRAQSTDSDAPAFEFSAGPQADWASVIQAARSSFAAGNLARAGEFYLAGIHNAEAAGVAGIHRAILLVELGCVRTAQGRCGEAADLARRGIQILGADPKPDSSALADAWGALGKAYECQHQSSKADRAYRRAIDIEQSAPAPRDNRLIDYLAAAGAVYQEEHRLAEAENALQRAQAILDRNPRVDPNAAAILLNNIGGLLRVRGRKAQSEDAFRQALAFVEASPKRDNAIEATLLSNVASMDYEHKDFRAAAARYRKAMDLIDSGAALTPRTTAQLFRDYAACLRKLGGRREAKVLESKAAALVNSQPDNAHLVVDVGELAPRK